MTETITAGSVKLKRLKKRRLSRIVFICTLMAIPVSNFVFFTIYTNLNTVLLSFQDRNLFTGEYIYVGFRNYVRIFQEFARENSAFPRAVLNSFLYFAMNNFILLPLSVLFAFLLNKKMPLANTFRVIFFLPSIVSIVVLTMVFKFMFDNSFGPVNDLLRALGLGKIIPYNGWFGDKRYAQWLILLYCFWVGIGGNIILVTGAINRIPTEIFEAGRLDGLGILKEFWHVVIPLIGSTIGVLFMLGITSFFTLFLQPKLLTNGGPLQSTFTIAFLIVAGVKEGSLTSGAAFGIICTIVGTPIVFGMRWIVDKFLPEYQY